MNVCINKMGEVCNFVINKSPQVPIIKCLLKSTVYPFILISTCKHQIGQSFAYICSCMATTPPDIIHTGSVQSAVAIWGNIFFLLSDLPVCCSLLFLNKTLAWHDKFSCLCTASQACLNSLIIRNWRKRHSGSSFS